MLNTLDEAHDRLLDGTVNSNILTQETKDMLVSKTSRAIKRRKG